MNYSEIYSLHIQLLKAYAANNNGGYSAYQREINHYRDQLRYAEDIVQRIFVLNQLVKLHEKEREDMMKWCTEQYFSRTHDYNESPDGNIG
ncbi:hypothetical protein MHH28_28555 [Paenibacillus sp. FSL K6-1217]|uniref:hypothetical protein n=1 Tax=Paenibacillus sp. FSL K6-1217 TaxID=2921466 RepID=UPI0032563351